MTPFWIELATLTIAVSFGMTAGWWLQIWTNSRRRHESNQEFQLAREKDRLRTKETMLHLQNLAADVAAHVGEHNQRVQSINDELTSPDGQTVDTVMDAIAKLIEANATMHEQLSVAEKKLEEQAREIEAQFCEARTDALTQVGNRRSFNEEMERCIKAHVSQGMPSSVMILDVDNFKQFNDNYGHKAGDEVLKSVAQTLQSDVSVHRFVYRYGGEEFAVIFPDLPLLESLAVAEQARAAIGSTQFDFEGKLLSIDASAGLTEIRSGDSMEYVVRRADEALYVSKRAGRNCGHYHDGVNFVRLAPVSTSNELSKSVVSVVPDQSSGRPYVRSTSTSTKLPEPGLASENTHSVSRSSTNSMFASNNEFRTASSDSKATAKADEKVTTRPGTRVPADKADFKADIKADINPEIRPEFKPVPALEGAASPAAIVGERPLVVAHECPPAETDKSAQSSESPKAVVVIDPLTGLSDRKAFVDDLNRRIVEWKRGGVQISVLLMKIDDYQVIGRTAGSKAQQMILRAALQFLRATMRNMDHIARFDEDTFAVMLPTASLSSAAGIADRLRRAVGRCKLPYESGPLSFTVSFGVAQAIRNDDGNRLMHRTTSALDTGVAAGGCANYLHNGETSVCATASS